MAIRAGSKKIIFGILLTYIVLVVVLYIVNVFFEVLGTSNDWRDFATYFAGMLAPVMAFGTICITYLVFRLNDDANKGEKYFERIVALYFEIQETYNNQCPKGGKISDGKEVAIYTERIQAKIRLMRYYLMRFPDLSFSIKSFDLALNNIWFDPQNEKYYVDLAYEFDAFCLLANQGQERPVKPITDKDGNWRDIDY